MKAIRYFRPDVLFAITPWHVARACEVCGIVIARDCSACRGDGWIAACGYKPPEGWRAEVKERGPRCVECEEIAIERENE